MSWTIVVAAIGVIIVTGAGALLTQIGPWYYSLRKPSWQPPDWLFGPAWTVIFLLAAYAGVSAYDRADGSDARTVIVALFALNIVLNMLWSALFFRWRRPDWALIEVVPLWLSIAAMIAAVAPFSTWGALALVPYILWVSFASYLNLTIVRLNRPFAGFAEAAR
jgi:tryptophan-rich sensory protein